MIVPQKVDEGQYLQTYLFYKARFHFEALILQALSNLLNFKYRSSPIK